MAELPQSKHFQLELLAEDVWAAIANDGGAAWGNAGIVDLGERVIVFDSMWTPQAARDLRAAAEQLAGKPIAYVINSHCHTDHVMGNQVFGATTDIITTKRTQELIVSNCRETLAWWRASGVAHIAAQERELEQQQDEGQRQRLGLKLQRERQFVAALPEMQLRVPNLTFDSWMIFQSRRAAEAISFGMGHTESDVFLYLPAARIVFVGDLLSVGNPPSMSSGDPQRWIAALDQIEALGPQVVVPGHGPVATAAEFDLLRQYISTLIAMADTVVGAGGSAEDAAAQPIPMPFDNWNYPDIYADNMRFLYKWLIKKGN